MYAGYHSGDDELDGDFEILPSITVTPKPSCSRIAPCSSCLNSPEDKTTAQGKTDMGSHVTWLFSMGRVVGE